MSFSSLQWRGKIIIVNCFASGRKQDGNTSLSARYHDESLLTRPVLWHALWRVAFTFLSTTCLCLKDIALVILRSTVILEKLDHLVCLARLPDWAPVSVHTPYTYQSGEQSITYSMMSACRGLTNQAQLRSTNIKHMNTPFFSEQNAFNHLFCGA